MATKQVLQLDAEYRGELRRKWAKLFKKFAKAHRACEHALTEKTVHGLRLAGRHCMPVLEVLRALRPKDAIWSMTYHAVRDLLDVLGPLRDAQVRRLRLETPKRKDRSINFLIARTAGEEKAFKPSAKAALALIGALPLQLLKGNAGRALLHATDLEKAIASTFDRRRTRLLDRWSAIAMRRPVSMHKARVALKRYRYLLIALEPCLSQELRLTLPKLEKIQGAIGKWHDDQLFMDWLKQAGRSGAQLMKRRSSGGTDRLKQLKPFLGKSAIA